MFETEGETESSAGTRARVPLGRLLGQVERQVSRRLESALAKEGLTVDQWRVLDLVLDGEGHPMSEIAAAIVVPGPTLTKIIDKLVDMALVYRLVDNRDRRRVLAFLSDKGRGLHQRIQPDIALIESQVLEVLGEDAPQLVTMLERLTRA